MKRLIIYFLFFVVIGSFRCIGQELTLFANVEILQGKVVYTVRGNTLLLNNLKLIPDIYRRDQVLICRESASSPISEYDIKKSINEIYKAIESVNIEESNEQLQSIFIRQCAFILLIRRELPGNALLHLVALKEKGSDEISNNSQLVLEVLEFYKAYKLPF